MVGSRKAFEAHHVHLSLVVDGKDYKSAETRAAWRTWRACRDFAITSCRKTESFYVNGGNLLKAQVCATVRTSLAQKL
jgi:hypothetical protein